MNKLIAVAAMLIACALPAAADEGHHHESKHGGVVVESGHHHLEIIAKDGKLEVHVYGEDGKPEDVKDAKATATVLAGGKKLDVVLAADTENVLKGEAAIGDAKGAVVVVTLTMPGHDQEQARAKLD